MNKDYIEIERESQKHEAPLKRPCKACPFRMNNTSTVTDRGSWEFLEKNNLGHVCHTSNSRSLCAGHKASKGLLKTSIKLFKSVEAMFAVKGRDL